MRRSLVFIFIFAVFVLHKHNIGVLSVKAKFTNVECLSLLEDYKFLKCRLKMVKRNEVGMFLHIQNKLPATNNLDFNIDFYKKTNSYQPFLYNLTFNLCKFLANRNSVPIAKMLFEEFNEFSNLNHTCPYTHDIIIDRFVLQAYVLKFLPIPSGEYLVVMREWYEGNALGSVKAYLTFF